VWTACCPQAEEHSPAPARSSRAGLAETRAREPQPEARARGSPPEARAQASHRSQEPQFVAVALASMGRGPPTAPGSARFSAQAWSLLRQEGSPWRAAWRHRCRGGGRRSNRRLLRGEAERQQRPRSWACCSDAPLQPSRFQVFVLSYWSRLQAPARRLRCSSPLSAYSQEIRPYSECGRPVGSSGQARRVIGRIVHAHVAQWWRFADQRR